MAAKERSLSRDVYASGEQLPFPTLQDEARSHEIDPGFNEENKENSTRPTSIPTLRRKRRITSRVRRPPPANGQVIEVLWEIPGQESDEDELEDHESDSGCVTGKSRLAKRQVWWPAKVLKTAENDSCQLQYTQSATSTTDMDLEGEVHEGVYFFVNGELQHTCGEYAGMVAEWRFCAWNSTGVRETAPKNKVLNCAGVVSKDINHEECRSAYLQLSERLKCTEATLLSLQKIVQGWSEMRTACSVTLKSQVMLDRTKRMLRTHLLSILRSSGNRGKSKRQKRGPSSHSSEHEIVREGVLKAQQADCTLSEFQNLATECVRLCGEGVEVRPNAYKTSFLNLRTRETMKIVFKTFPMLCKALGIEEHLGVSLLVQETKVHYGCLMKVRVIGFSINRSSAGMSDSLILVGVGSTWIRSPLSKKRNVSYRPMAKWNGSEACYGSTYGIAQLSATELQEKYRSAYWGASTSKNGNGNLKNCFLGGDTGQVARATANDFQDFEFSVEWIRKSDQIMSAFAASASSEDILGDLICTLPCVDVGSSPLCQSIIDLSSSL